MVSFTNLHWHLEHLTVFWKRLSGRVQVWRTRLHTECNVSHHHSAFQRKGITGISMFQSSSTFHTVNDSQVLDTRLQTYPFTPSPHKKLASQEALTSRAQKNYFWNCCSFILSYNPLQNLLNPRIVRKYPKNSCILQHILICQIEP